MVLNLSKYKRVSDGLVLEIMEKASELTYRQVGKNYTLVLYSQNQLFIELSKIMILRKLKIQI